MVGSKLTPHMSTGGRVPCQQMLERFREQEAQVVIPPPFNIDDDNDDDDNEDTQDSTTSTSCARRSENNSVVRRPGVDYDIELIWDGFTNNRVPILEEEMTCSTIDKVGSRVDSGGDYMMKENNKERRLNAEVDSIQPKKSKKCRDSKISDRFQEFALMQLRILKNMGIYVDEEDIEEFKDLIKEIIEGLFLLEEDVKKM
ncbi:hypothetical protein PSTG_03276 [Puccinia striiformis f. sp. tritici PST-78]|uniref:Uncharacterized protein n=1 Tax=Puccinia striiformis f. sp. tritici PST-78 TaxID=1165861 RepID=A0A0L0VXJ1_9BASI|nr:hypothetical protein PSTG_03276 [Puccinia striiformis f. sp. tritici PST-78]